MAYPSRWADGRNPEKEDVDVKMEWVPVDKKKNEQALDTRLGLVHFDLCVQNTMIGDFNLNHPRTPEFKVC